MKIDFVGRYRDVSRLLEAPVRPPELSKINPDFGKLLGEISPFASQSIDNKPEIAETKTPAMPQAPTDKGPMARLAFPEPSLMPPVIERLAPEISPEGPVNPSTEGVKAPEVLSAKRVAVNSNFDTLSKVERQELVTGLIEKAGISHGIDPALGLSVARAESSFDTYAVSRDGHNSKGLFQLLDSTGKELLANTDPTKAYSPFDAEQNVDLGVRYLRKLHNIFSQATPLPNNMTTTPAANSSSLEKLAVAAFNAGEGRVASAQQRAGRAGMDPANYDSVAIYLPESTQQYVERVIGSKPDFSFVQDS